MFIRAPGREAPIIGWPSLACHGCLLPTTYLIGRDGKVAKRIQGKRTLAQFRAEVEPLLE